MSLACIAYEMQKWNNVLYEQFYPFGTKWFGDIGTLKKSYNSISAPKGGRERGYVAFNSRPGGRLRSCEFWSFCKKKKSLNFSEINLLPHHSDFFLWKSSLTLSKSTHSSTSSLRYFPEGKIAKIIPELWDSAQFSPWTMKTSDLVPKLS